MGGVASDLVEGSADLAGELGGGETAGGLRPSCAQRPCSSALSAPTGPREDDVVLSYHPEKAQLGRTPRAGRYSPS